MSNEDDRLRLEYLKAFYHEIGENRRLYDRLIWEIPTLTITIASGIVALAFGYVQNSVVRAVVILLAIFWVFAMLVVSTKHQYFARIQAKRLAMIEYDMGFVPLQRFTRKKTVKSMAEKSKGEERRVWSDIYSKIEEHWDDPKGLERLSAWRTLRWSIMATLLSLIILEFYVILCVIQEVLGKALP